MRRSTLYLGLTAVSLTGLLLLLLVHPPLMRARSQERLEAEKGLVRRLGITDLCLFTDSRYSRHPSQADLHSAFQDNPGSFDLFPSGSIVAPTIPRSWGESHGYNTLGAPEGSPAPAVFRDGFHGMDR
ncbi:MAG: hypothetical protein ACUVXD_18900 [Thermodesulfobacteriota bacterium]